MTSALDERAREALRLAEADPARSAVLAQAVAREARQERDPAPMSIAERVLGMTSLQLEDPDAAVRHLRLAVRLGRQANSAELEAEARMGLAFALNVRGRGRQAVREIELALSALSGVARARAQAQRGAILTQLGRLDEAYPDYQAALPVLRSADDHVWVQRVLYNRAVLYGYRLDFAAAEADLSEAAELCTKLGLDLSLGFVHQNLSWISGLRGDVPAALHYLHLAERCLREHGAPVGELLTDRCQLLLSVRLLPEAMQAAEDAVREFERQHRNIVLPDARLLLAQVAIVDGQAGLGLQQARMATREFGRQGRLRWAKLARFAVLRAQLACGSGVVASGAGRVTSGAGVVASGAGVVASGAGVVASGAGHGVSVRQLERAADDLAEAGWPLSVLEARLLAGELALQRGWTGRARAQFQLAARQRSRGPAMHRAQGWYAEARQRWAGGDRRGATAAARTALRIIDEHRAGLGATDLRAHASGHRVQIAEFGLRMAFESGQPAQVLEWAENGRASHLMLRPARPPGDPGLAAALSELRATVNEIFKLRAAGDSTTLLERRQVALERQIRDHHRRLPPDQASAPARPVRLRRLRDRLGDAALLEFVRLDDTLHVVTVAGGRIRLHRLCPAAEAYGLIDRVRFALHRMARHHVDDARSTAARALLAHAAERLDALLLRPVTSEIADRPLVLVPTGALQSLPWSVLPSCAGRPVTVTPSAALWDAGQPGQDQRGPVVVAAGPGLPGAETEAATIASLYRVTPLMGAAASVEAVTTGLDGAGLVHLAAHGHIHPDNPLFTSLTLANGPLTVYDVESLDRAPRMVVLAACDLGRPTVRAGDEVMGLSATFLALGTRQIIASVVPVTDAETAPLMIAFHRLLAAGQPAVAALARAQRQLHDSHPASMAAAAGFLSIGPGTWSAAS